MPLATLALLANTTADPLAGGAGWAGVGLLGAVLSWLLFIHLPAKDKINREKDEAHAVTQRELIERHDAAVKDLLDRNQATMRDLRETFSDALREVTNHCKDELAQIVGHLTGGKT